MNSPKRKRLRYRVLLDDETGSSLTVRTSLLGCNVGVSCRLIEGRPYVRHFKRGRDATHGRLSFGAVVPFTERDRGGKQGPAPLVIIACLVVSEPVETDGRKLRARVFARLFGDSPSPGLPSAESVEDASAGGSAEQLARPLRLV